MDFYYNPITGLQWTGGTGIINVNLDAIPNDFDVNKVLKVLKEYGLLYYNSLAKEPATAINNITTNAILYEPTTR